MWPCVGLLISRSTPSHHHYIYIYICKTIFINGYLVPDSISVNPTQSTLSDAHTVESSRVTDKGPFLKFHCTEKRSTDAIFTVFEVRFTLEYDLYLENSDSIRGGFENGLSQCKGLRNSSKSGCLIHEDSKSFGSKLFCSETYVI